jgi:hypothetical protein
MFMPPDSTGDQMGLWLGFLFRKLLAGTFLGALYAATSSFSRADRSTALAVLLSMLMNRTGRFDVEEALDTLHGDVECVDAGLMWAISERCVLGIFVCAQYRLQGYLARRGATSILGESGFALR